MNWDSARQTYSPVVGVETKQFVDQAKNLRAKGKTVKQIAEELGKSESRICEYLR